MDCQSIIFSKEYFTKQSTLDYLKKKNIKYIALIETQYNYRFRIEERDNKNYIYKCIKLSPGIVIIIKQLNTKIYWLSEDSDEQ